MSENSKSTFTKIVAVSIIVIGVAILLQKNFNGVNLWMYIWPFIPIVLGLMMVRYSIDLMHGGKSFLCIFGCIVSTTGLLVLFSVATSYWNIWYYGWALIFPASYGIGKNIVGMTSKKISKKGQGNRSIFLGIVFFVLGLGLFEYVSQFKRIMETSSGKITLGYALICLGIYVLVPNQFNSKIIFEDVKIRRKTRTSEKENDVKDDIRIEQVVEVITNDEDESEDLVEDFLTE